MAGSGFTHWSCTGNMFCSGWWKADHIIFPASGLYSSMCACRTCVMRDVLHAHIELYKPDAGKSMGESWEAENKKVKWHLENGC